MGSYLAILGSLGIGQILVWGASFYLPAVLGQPVQAATGWPPAWVTGALSIGLLVSGLASPAVGRAIERRGGRTVMAASAILLCIGLAVAGVAPSLWVFLTGWVVIGFAMAAGLYEPAFATLGQIYGGQARSAITHLTLFGGFASTICWPLSAFLVAHVGWRGTYLAYAVIAVLVVLPVYLLGLPPGSPARPMAPHEPRHLAPRGDQRIAYLILAASLTLASFIMTLVALEVLVILQARGLTLAAAVSLGILIGPAQVGARLVESLLGKQRHPIWTLIASSGLVALGLATLMGGPGAITMGLILYGLGSGIRSIAQGTVPLALFGSEGYASLMGKLAFPKLVAQAAAPTAGTLMLDHLGVDTTIVLLFAAALVNTGLSVALLPFALGRPALSR